MIDNFSLALTHGLLLLVAWRLLFRADLDGATLVAAAGCYVTAASMALAPLVRTEMIETTGIIVDAASGELLWRKNLTQEQMQAVQFEVYTNSQAMINAALDEATSDSGPTRRRRAATPAGTPGEMT